MAYEKDYRKRILKFYYENGKIKTLLQFGISSSTLYGWSRRGLSIERRKSGLRYSRINLVYLPDLNLIEKVWASMKKELKDVAHNFSTPEEAVTSVLFDKIVFLK